MEEKSIRLGQYGDRLLWGFFDSGKYIACATQLRIGPLPNRRKAKQAICDLIDAERLYLARSMHLSYPMKPNGFRNSSECKEIFNKYKLPEPAECWLL